MKKKKILYVTESMGGGVFYYIQALANALSHRYEIYVAFSRRKQTPSDIHSFFEKNVHLIELKNFTRKISPVRDFQAIQELRKIVNLVNPDIIHLNSSKAGAIGRLSISGRKRVLFYTPHGYSFLMNQNTIKEFAYKFIEMMLAKARCTTISCSKSEHLVTLGLNHNAEYVNNGIDTLGIQSVIKDESNNSIEEREIEAPITVCTIGRISQQKNPSLFNQVALKLPHVKFVWIGDGELREQLNAPNIEITGWISRTDVLKKCSNMDFFMLPSLWEGLSLSLLEAMYLEKICLVSNIPENNSIINDKQNGFVCSTVDDYVDIISSFKKNQTMLRQIASRARKDIEREYTQQIMIDKYIKIYEKSLGNREDKNV